MKTTPRSKRGVRTPKAKGVRPVRMTEVPEGDVIEMVPRLLTIRRILVPLDFSESAEKALRYAVSFARQFDARITLLHVRPTPYYPIGIGGALEIAPVAEPSPKKIQAHLDAEARRLVPSGMCERTALRVGAADHEICEAARAFAVDLIIIATHGRTGFKRAFIGSTAERVVRHAPCPVLVVREHEQEFA